MTGLMIAIRERAMCPVKLLPIALFILYVSATVPAIILYPTLALPIVGAVFFFLAILWEPFLGVLLAAVLGMVGDLQHFAGSISVAKFVFLLTLLSFFGRVLIQKNLNLVKTGLEAPVFTFILIYNLGTFLNLNAFNEEYAVSGAESIVTMLGYPLAFLLFLNLARTEEKIKWVLYAIALGAFITGVVSLLQQFTGINLLSSVRGIEQIAASNAAGMDRQDGLMMDPNAAAYPQLFGLPILLLLLISSKSPVKRLCLAFMAAVCLFGLALTFSRSGYIGFAAGLLSLSFFLRGQRTFKIYATFAILLLMLTSFIPASTLFERFGMIGDEMDGVSDRSVYFRTAVMELIEHPILPSGEADFMAKIEQKVGVRQGPHANLQAIMINSGLLGLAALAWLIVRYVRLLRRGLKTMPDSPLRNYAVGVCMAIIAFQVQGFFITNMTWFLLWAILAIPLCCILCNNANQNATTHENVIG